MAQVTNNYLDVGTGKLYYEMAGEGNPLLLLHAGFVDSRMWDDQWLAFTKHYRVIRVDLRGFGKSDPVTEPLSRRAELYHLCQELHIDQASFIGCSLSGETVLDFALEHPTMVSALVVVSAVPSGFQMQGQPPRYLFDMMNAVQNGDLALASELQNRIWIDGSFREPEQVDPLIRQRAAEMNRIALVNGTWSKAEANPIDPLNPPAIKRLHEIHAPTLIIAGSLDHPEILRASEVMAASIANAQSVIIPNAAHLPNMEDPAGFNHVVLNFLHEQNTH